MAIQANQNGGRSGVNVPVLIAALIVLVVLLVWLGYRSFGPPPAPKPSAAAEQREAGWDALAKKSHGDISKLSPQEQQQLMKETGGHGAQILQNLAKQHGY